MKFEHFFIEKNKLFLILENIRLNRKKQKAARVVFEYKTLVIFSIELGKTFIMRSKNSGVEPTKSLMDYLNKVLDALKFEKNFINYLSLFIVIFYFSTPTIFFIFKMLKSIFILEYKNYALIYSIMVIFRSGRVFFLMINPVLGFTDSTSDYIKLLITLQ